MAVEIDKPVPPFEAQATNNIQVRLEALRGKQVVLYFYPKDNTPGCTTEGQGFRDMHEAFSECQHPGLRCFSGQPQDS